MDYKPVYLINVDDEFGSQGHNKYYTMIPEGNSFTVKYGRVGSSEQTRTYPISQWNKKLNEKLKKGYTEISDLMSDVINDSEITEDSTEKDKFSSIAIESIREVIKRLYEYANNMVTSSYRVSSTVVTQDQIDTAQKQIDFISSNYNDWDLKKFNTELKNLFKILPRKMKTVKEYLAQDMGEDTIQKIIMREQDTLDSLAGMVYVPKSLQKSEGIEQPEEQKTERNILQEMGIEMEETSVEEDEMLKKLMGDVSDKFYKAWRVCNQETEDRYREFQEKYNLEHKLCCHGSRNANWVNILKTGLKLKPSNVVINGKMFGLGCYYSNPDKPIGGVRKSIGYTSLSGSYWVGGSSNCGFLAFFEVALGKPYDVYSFDSQYYNMDLKKLKEKDPDAWHLWAHGNTSMLRNDELVVYTEEQMTIRYLVEIR